MVVAAGAGRWRTFFIFAGGAAVISVAISVVVTVAFDLSVPADCPACGLAAVGLVPFYLVSAVLVATVLVGCLVWLVRWALRGGDEDAPR